MNAGTNTTPSVCGTLSVSGPASTASATIPSPSRSHWIAARDPTDSFGATGAASASFSIYDNRPFASFVVNPSPATCSQPASFDASASHHGRPDRSIVSYAWDFGDGASGSGKTTSHTYARQGTYTVVLTVTDDNAPAKTATATASLTVNIDNHAPVASLAARTSRI